MKTANLAIVFTDIKGFTERTSQQTLEENERLLATHAALLTPLFRAFGGKIVKSIGDAFMVTFESPTQAVLAGAAIQDRLWQHNRNAPAKERFDVRIGINVGEVRLEGGDAFGEPVNIASRVEHVAEPGEVFFTEAVYLAMNKAEVPSEEVGAVELKGIPGKISIFKVPRAPYRVEASTATQPPSDEAPPFGNLGLAKVPDDLAARGRVVTGEIAVKAAELVEKTTTALVQRKLAIPRRALAAVGVLGAIVVALVLLRGMGIEGAISAVEKAPASQRGVKAEEARRQIDQLTDRGERAYYLGRLAEARGDSCASHYIDAAHAGFGKAEDRLIDLLGHEKCRYREAAAEALGSLELKRAKGALEDLAEEGGPGESDVPLIGCDSKQAAQSALRRLK
ncbi:MAG: adenylate/guanylate cyclase domain-containing protein [Myxococcota bacterium]